MLAIFKFLILKIQSYYGANFTPLLCNSSFMGNEFQPIYLLRNYTEWPLKLIMEKFTIVQLLWERSNLFLEERSIYFWKNVRFISGTEDLFLDL